MTQNTVEVRMKFTADGKQATGEVASTRREVEKLGKEAQKTQQELKRMGAGGGAGGGGGGVAAGGGTGGRESGDNAKLFTMWSKAIGIVMMFGKALEGASKAVDIYQQAHLNNTQKFIGAAAAIGNELTFGATSYIEKKLTDIYFSKSKVGALNALAQEGYQSNVLGIRAGEGQRLRQLQEEHEFGKASAQVRADKAQGTFDLREWALRNRDNPAMKDRIDPQLINAQISMKEAFGQSGALDEAYIRSRNNVGARKDELAALIKERDKMPLGGNMFSAEENAVKWRLKNLEIAQKQKEVEDAINQRKQRGMEFTQSYYEASKKSVEVRQTELSLLKQRETMQKSSERDFNIMGASDKMALKYAVDQAKNFGIENVDEDTRRQLLGSGLTREWATEGLDRFGQNDPTRQAIIEAVGGKSAKQLGEESIQLERKINIELKELDENTAAQIKKVLKEHLDDMDEHTKKMVEQQLRMLLNQRKNFE